MGRGTIRDPDGHSWEVRRRWTLSVLPAGPEAAGALKRRLGNWRRSRSAARSTANSPGGDMAAGVLEVFDEVGLIIAILAAVVLAALLLTAFFVALLIELVLAMVLLIMGVVWRVVLRRPWTVEAVRRVDAPDALETIVVDPVKVGDEAAGGVSTPDRSDAPGSGHAPVAVAELPSPDVVSMPDDVTALGGPDRRAVPLRLAWRVVGWRASGALRRSVADHLSAVGHGRFVADR